MTAAPRPLRFASLMADNITSTCRALAGHLEDRGFTIHWVDASWQDIEEQLDAGTIDMAPICGLGYVRRLDLQRPLELLASPVMAGELYGDEPIYYSHVLVDAASRFQTFDDLRGCSFATNEPGSQSGYNLIRAHLYDVGERHDFFQVEVISGSHARSLELLADGEVDAALVDSTVFEHQDIYDSTDFRILETLGPSAIPPVVISTDVPSDLRRRLREIFLDLHHHEEGRRILALGGLKRFAALDRSAYEPIWQMNEKAKRVRLAPAVRSIEYDLKRRHLVVQESSSSARPALTRAQLDAQVHEHQQWLHGEGGRPAFLAGANLAGANLESLDLTEAVLDGANLAGAHLHGTDLSRASLRDARAEGADLRATTWVDADLTGANLRGARLGDSRGMQDSTLRGVDLDEARGLTGSEFAGVDLTGATLPDRLADFSGLTEVEEVSRASQHLLFTVLLIAGYALLLLVTTPINVLEQTGSAVELPLVGTEVPTSSAFIGLPVALSAVYLFFHLSMRRLWIALSTLPAVFPDGRTLDQRVYPWALGGLVRRHVPALREREASPGERLEEWSAIALGWIAVPTTLLAFGLGYLRRGDVAGSLGHAVVLVLTISFSAMSYSVARRALRGELRT